MATALGKLFEKVGDKLGEITAGKVIAAMGAATTAAGLWVWHHVNPEFSYKAAPSGASQRVSLAQVLSQLDRDSQVYCTGGWDQRIANAAWRSCWQIEYAPVDTLRTTVCTRDPRAADIATTDQRVGLRFFVERYAPLQCFALDETRPPRLKLTPGAGSHAVALRFAGQPSTERFCGCSDTEIAEAATAMGATVAP